MLGLTGRLADKYIYPSWIKDTLSKRQVRLLQAWFPRGKRVGLTYVDFCEFFAKQDGEQERQLWKKLTLIPFPDNEEDKFLSYFLIACDAALMHWDDLAIEKEGIMAKVSVTGVAPVIASPVVKPFNRPKFFRLMAAAFIGFAAVIAFFVFILLPLLYPKESVETPVPVATRVNPTRNLDQFGMTREEAEKFLTAFKSFSKIPVASRTDASLAYRWKNDFKLQLGLKGKITADSSNEAVRKAFVEGLLNKHNWNLNSAWAEIE